MSGYKPGCLGMILLIVLSPFIAVAAVGSWVWGKVKGIVK